ncbi:uncharacterized protein BDW70DRAFT_143346 [Aspergillus foveolatus]|uniref:uncharacterized protein n=1 Tax=Aspergillus foveolatus TaxID=210207 RepID=UPI003CCD08D3
MLAFSISPFVPLILLLTPSSGLPLASPDAQGPTTRRNEALSTDTPRCLLAVPWTQPVMQQLRRISGRRLILQSLKWRWRSHRSECIIGGNVKVESGCRVRFCGFRGRFGKLAVSNPYLPTVSVDT